jgi:hypothetical protein
MQYASGILLPPVQKLVATFISAHRAEMQTNPSSEQTSSMPKGVLFLITVGFGHPSTFSFDTSPKYQ